MLKQRISRLTTKQIVMYIVVVIVAIYIVWYVIDALEGFEPNYVPAAAAGGFNQSQLR